MSAQDNTRQPQSKPFVNLTGTAKEGCLGPAIGLGDIGMSESAYIFRVALPGIRKDQSKLNCEVERNGRVHIQGVATKGRVLKSVSTMHQMITEQMCPPGHFSISFRLPGPVDPRLCFPKFRPDGILEVVVMKYRGGLTNKTDA